MARQPFNARAYKKLLGVRKLFGERGFTPDEQRTARPTLEINGFTSGYQGEGSKTIVPAWARAKITTRLVPNQSPARITKLFIQHLKQLCPPTVRIEIKPGHGAEPYLVSPTSPRAQSALRAIKAAFQREPDVLREGGSIRIVTDCNKMLHACAVPTGPASPHPNA